MTWPTDRTFTIHDVNTLVYQQILPSTVNLLTQNDDKLFQIAFRRGAIEPYVGGDEFKVPVIIAGGDASKEYDPSIEEPTTTVSSTAYKILAPSNYKIYGRTKNVNFAQDLEDMSGGPLAVADIMSKVYLSNFMKMIEELTDNGSSPGGFYNTTSVLPTSGITNAKAMFAITGDFAEVVVATYDKYKPALVNASSSDGANLISADITLLLNSCDRASEGFPTDIVTAQTVWNKIISLKAAKNVATVGPASIDFGARNTTEHGGVPIHWSRHLKDKNIAWDVTDTTTQEYAFLAIDFNSVRFRIKQGGAQPGDEYGFITRVGPLALHPLLLKWFQRVRFMGQWYFQGARRTSGHMEGISNLTAA